MDQLTQVERNGVNWRTCASALESRATCAGTSSRCALCAPRTSRLRRAGADADVTEVAAQLLSTGRVLAPAVAQRLATLLARGRPWPGPERYFGERDDDLLVALPRRNPPVRCDGRGDGCGRPACGAQLDAINPSSASMRAMGTPPTESHRVVADPMLVPNAWRIGGATWALPRVRQQGRSVYKRGHWRCRVEHHDMPGPVADRLAILRSWRLVTDGARQAPHFRPIMMAEAGLRCNATSGAVRHWRGGTGPAGDAGWRRCAIQGFCCS
jgi:hypothetical protein